MQGFAWFTLPQEGRGFPARVFSARGSSAAAPAAKPDAASGQQRRLGQRMGMVVFLSWTHGVIGWGFFLLQFWIPSYLHTLPGVPDSALGVLSALPWAVRWVAMSRTGMGF